MAVHHLSEGVIPTCSLALRDPSRHIVNELETFVLVELFPAVIQNAEHVGFPHCAVMSKCGFHQSLVSAAGGFGRLPGKDVHVEHVEQAEDVQAE